MPNSAHSVHLSTSLKLGILRYSAGITVFTESRLLLLRRKQKRILYHVTELVWRTYVHSQPLRGKQSQTCLQFISWSITSGAYAAHCPAHTSTKRRQREALRMHWSPNSQASSRAQGQGEAHAGAASRPGHAAAAEQGLSCFPRASLPHLPALAPAQPAGSAHHTWHSARWLVPFFSAPRTRLSCNPLPTP